MAEAALAVEPRVRAAASEVMAAASAMTEVMAVHSVAEAAEDLEARLVVEVGAVVEV